MQQPERAAPGAAPGPWNFEVDTTLIRILAANAQALPQRVAMREKDRGIWQQITWQQTLEQVLRCAAGLQSLGLKPGEAILVLGDNRPHLYMGMLSAGALRGYAMPVFPDATPDEILHVVQHVHVRFVLAEDQEQVDKVLDLRERGAPIEQIVYDNPRGLGRYKAPGLISWADLQALGARRLAEESRTAPGADRAGGARGPGGLHPLLGHHRQAQRCRAQPPQYPGRRAQCLPGARLRLRRGRAGVPADGVDRRLRHHGGRRRRAALHDQRAGAPGDGAAKTCARWRPPSTWPHRAAGTTC